jgi:hypothetical protein
MEGIKGTSSLKKVYTALLNAATNISEILRYGTGTNVSLIFPS